MRGEFGPTAGQRADRVELVSSPKHAEAEISRDTFSMDTYKQIAEAMGKMPDNPEDKRFLEGISKMKPAKFLSILAALIGLTVPAIERATAYSNEIAERSESAEGKMKAQSLDFSVPMLDRSAFESELLETDDMEMSRKDVRRALDGAYTTNIKNRYNKGAYNIMARQCGVEGDEGILLDAVQCDIMFRGMVEMNKFGQGFIDTVSETTDLERKEMSRTMRGYVHVIPDGSKPSLNHVIGLEWYGEEEMTGHFEEGDIRDHYLDRARETEVVLKNIYNEVGLESMTPNERRVLSGQLRELVGAKARMDLMRARIGIAVVNAEYAGNDEWIFEGHDNKISAIDRFSALEENFFVELEEISNLVGEYNKTPSFDTDALTQQYQLANDRWFSDMFESKADYLETSPLTGSIAGKWNNRAGDIQR